MTQSKAEIHDQLVGAMQAHPEVVVDWLDENIDFLGQEMHPTKFYCPDSTLIDRIADYLSWLAGDQRDEDAGKLMEEIAVLAFRCLRGWDVLKSYQSYGAQIDLAVTGSGLYWRLLMGYLHLDYRYRTVVVEAKNLSDRVNDSQFSRLCSILESQFAGLSNLGVFLTRRGATGFPSASDTEQNSRRLRTLSDAQATQIIFHARTSKYVVVLDHDDICRLTEPGALPSILEAKIRAVGEWTGKPVQLDEECKEVDLPSHLAQYVNGEDSTILDQ